jgi:elongation factor P
MYSITDLKKDTLIQLDGTPYKVVDYAQKQMGRGGSIVNLRIKNLLDGSVIPKTFKGQEKIEPADVTNQKVQFLYADGNNAHFMDEQTYDQFEIGNDVLGDGLKYLKDGSSAQAQLFEGRVINVDLPVKVALKVTESPDVVRGDTQSTVLKTVTLENGTEAQTPIFIKQGDTVIIDTRDGSYVERQK